MGLRKRAVVRDFLEAECPQPTASQWIGLVVKAQGQLRFQAKLARADELVDGVVCLPNKFRNCIFVNRGAHVLVDQSEGPHFGEIAHVFLPKHIAELTARGCWPFLN